MKFPRPPLPSALLVPVVVFAAVTASCATAPLSPTDACNRTAFAASADAVCPLLPGMAVPDVTVVDTDGKPVSLATLTQSPTVLIFYRGGWCPYCNTQMGQLQQLEEDLAAQGFKVVAISPDGPDGLKASIAKHNLGYRLLSDTPLAAAKAFGVAFRVDPVMSVALTAMAPQNAGLPVPAVFVVQDGVVRFSYANPNFKVRLAPEVLLAAVKAAGRAATPPSAPPG